MPGPLESCRDMVVSETDLVSTLMEFSGVEDE